MTCKIIEIVVGFVDYKGGYKCLVIAKFLPILTEVYRKNKLISLLFSLISKVILPNATDPYRSIPKEIVCF